MNPFFFGAGAFTSALAMSLAFRDSWKDALRKAFAYGVAGFTFAVLFAIFT